MWNPGTGPRWYPAHVLSGVAQMAERRTVNPQVVGSSPTPGATNSQVRADLSRLALSASLPAFQHLSNPSPLPAPEKRSDLLAGLPGPSRIGVPVDVRCERRRVVAHLSACRWQVGADREQLSPVPMADHVQMSVGGDSPLGNGPLYVLPPMLGNARRKPRSQFAVREHVLRAEALREQLVRL